MPRTAHTEQGLNQPDAVWLGLRAASRQLGVHENTLRRWADQGMVLSRRTAGGHRRFRPADLQVLAPVAGGTPQTEGAGLPVWQPERLGVEQRAQLRAMGQRLTQLVQRFLSEGPAPTQLLSDARQIGRAYASRAIGTGMPLSEAVAAFLFYRSHLIATLGTDPRSGSERYERYERVVGAVLVGLAQGYESCFTMGGQGQAGFPPPLTSEGGSPPSKPISATPIRSEP